MKQDNERYTLQLVNTIKSNLSPDQ